jgi:hypothetical protein
MLHTFVALIQDKAGVLTRLASLLLVLAAASASAQTVQIHLRFLDGRNGKPISNQQVHVFDFTHQQEIPTSRTDQLGRVLVIVSEDSVINAGTRDFIDCTKSSNVSYTSGKVNQILLAGVIGGNLCGKASAAPAPGELVVFVRPWGFWEKLKVD